MQNTVSALRRCLRTPADSVCWGRALDIDGAVQIFCYLRRIFCYFATNLLSVAKHRIAAVFGKLHLRQYNMFPVTS